MKAIIDPIHWSTSKGLRRIRAAWQPRTMQCENAYYSSKLEYILRRNGYTVCVWASYVCECCELHWRRTMARSINACMHASMQLHAVLHGRRSEWWAPFGWPCTMRHTHTRARQYVCIRLQATTNVCDSFNLCFLVKKQKTKNKKLVLVLLVAGHTSHGPSRNARVNY